MRLEDAGFPRATCITTIVAGAKARLAEVVITLLHNDRCDGRPECYLPLWG